MIVSLLHQSWPITHDRVSLYVYFENIREYKRENSVLRENKDKDMRKFSDSQMAWEQ